MSTTILNNRDTAVSCEVTYNDPDLIVGMVVREYDSDENEYVEVAARKLAVPSGPYTYGALFTPAGEATQFIVELMVFNDVEMTDRNFDYGISSRAFTVDSYIQEQFDAISTLVSSLASLLNISPQVNVVAKLEKSSVNGKVVRNPSVIGIVESEEVV